MTDLKLVLWPDPQLKMKSMNVRPEAIPLWLNSVKSMIEIMERHNGVGLSGVQIGLPYRIVVSKFAEPMLNPVITGFDIKKVQVVEGCLSLPGFFEKVWRYPSIQMLYMDLDGMGHEAVFTGLAAQCFQHELEHLDGHFFTEHLPAGERSRIRGEVQKLKRAGKWK